jgi:transcriptional regulator with XRE-family HTH domain
MLRSRKVFAANMRAIRLDKNLSQEELAEASGLHRTYIGSVERGERNISLDNIEKIAKALGVDVPELFRKVQ